MTSPCRRSGLGLLLALVVVAALAACAAEPEPRVVQPGAPGEGTRVLDADEVPALDAAEYSEADVRFAQMMIPHHLQALQMTSLVPDRTSRDDVPLLAERMDVSQVGEIEQLQRWLRDRGEPLPSADAHLHHGAPGAEGTTGAAAMPGMLSAEEMDRLEAASGEEFDRLFLRFMIRHHEGALAMVAELLAAEDGGLEPEIGQLANHIDADQRLEINRMVGMLAELEGAAPAG